MTVGQHEAQKTQYSSHDVEQTAYARLTVAKTVHRGTKGRIRLCLDSPSRRAYMSCGAPDMIHRSGHEKIKVEAAILARKT
jgi:hypothetical protein